MSVSCASLRALALLAGLSLAACGGLKPEVRAALDGTLPDLQRAIAKAEASGPLSDDRLGELAQAVAEREIAAASGPDGSAQLLVFRPCLSELEGAINERASRGDEVAATATLLLFEAGKRDAAELVRRYREADSGAYRALAARAALERSEAELRRRYLTDPDERVRRGALEAARKAPNPALLPDLIEAARLDPNPLNRSRAAQAIGRIGSERSVLGLVDLFAAGDEQDQLAVLDAWSDPSSLRAGGERELARALSRPGLVGVSAAALLLRSRESRAAAVAVLARAIAEGSDDARRVALMAAPLEEESVRKALMQAAESPSPELTPVVLARLADVPGQAQQARERLEKLAQDPSDYGLEASYTLARLGSPSAIARLEQELSHERAGHRLRAAVTLTSLGKRRRLAPRLADRDPLVRATLACQLTEAL